MELEDDFLAGNFEFPLESEPTAKQDAHLTPKTTKKYATLADIDSNIDSNIEEPDEKEARQKSQKDRGSKEKENKTLEETRVIIQLEEFDWATEDNTGWWNVQRFEAHSEYCYISEKLWSDGEDNTSNMQKSIDGLAQKMIKYVTAYVTATTSTSGLHSNATYCIVSFSPPASSHQNVNEPPMGQSTPIPIAPLSTKYKEMLATEVPKEKLKTIAENSQKYISSCTKSKIGVLAVKLARGNFWRWHFTEMHT